MDFALCGNKAKIIVTIQDSSDKSLLKDTIFDTLVSQLVEI
jgi:hypothetical protein